MKASLVFLVLLCATLMCVWGCKQEDTIPPSPPWHWVESVHINMVDTLTFLPGDSAIADGWVTVYDRDHLVIPGVPVQLSLDSFGTLEYLDPAKGDTTNEVGRLNFRFRSYGQSGMNSIVASCEGRSTSFQFVVLQAWDVLCHLNVSIGRSREHPDFFVGDSARVSLTLSDCDGRGIPNYPIKCSASGGRIPSIARTDSAGDCKFYWYFDDFGVSCLYFSIHDLYNHYDLNDSACVTVTDTSQTQF